MTALTPEEEQALRRLKVASTTPVRAVQNIIRREGLDRELDEIAEQLAVERHCFDMAGSTSEDREQYQRHVLPLTERQRVIYGRAWQILWKALRSGEMIAFGVRVPLDFDQQWMLIPPIVWSVLGYDPEKNVAQGSGYEFRDIEVVGLAHAPELRELVQRAIRTTEGRLKSEQVRKRDTETPSSRVAHFATVSIGRVEIAEPLQVKIVQSESAPNAAGRQTGSSPERGPSFVGRPTVMHLIQCELEGRASAGRLLPSLRQECEALAAWAKEKMPDQQTPTSKAIENALRGIYRKLRPNLRPETPT